MSSPIKSSSLRFPKKDAIVDFLTKHPSTNNTYLTETRIIETVSKLFANQKLNGARIGIEVMLSLYDLNKTLKLPHNTLVKIQQCLTQALKDCAKANFIDLKKYPISKL